MSTLVRQLFFDIVFVTENVTLLAIALSSNIKEFNEHRLTFIVVLLGFTSLVTAPCTRVYGVRGPFLSSWLGLSLIIFCRFKCS